MSASYSLHERSPARSLPPKKRFYQAFMDVDDDAKPSAVEPPRQEETPLALEQLRQAFEVIPDDLKAAYLEAKEKAPHIVETESNPVWFLRFEQCNFWGASKRIATYWRERKDLFGDRAHLPFKDLSGQGALNECDLRALRRGGAAILPKDDDGRGVFLFDRSRFQSNDTYDSRRRILFFLLSLLSETEMSQTEGFVFIGLLSTSGGTPDMGNIRRFFGSIKAALPCRMKAVIQVSLLPKMGRRTFMQMILPVFFVYVGDSPQDLCEKLQDHSLNPNGLPESVGGIWNYDCYEQWLFAPDPDWTKGPEVIPAGLPAGEAYAVAKEMQHDGESGKPRARLRPREVPLEDGEIHGYMPDFLERASVAQRCCYELEQALALLPGHETTAYMEAVKRSLDLIEPFAFLRYDKYNAWAAARRLAVYWEKRRGVFGERAFLPMTQTGEGALSKEDVALLDTGYLSLLPDDSDGNPVVCYDGSRLPLDLDDADGKKRLRCLFYTLSVLSERREASRAGFIAIEIVNSRVKRCEKLGDYFVELADKVLPVHLKALHLVHSPTDSGKTTFLEIIVPQVMKLCGAAAYEKIHVHSGSTTDALLEKLSAFGFLVERLPESIGGTWMCPGSAGTAKKTEFVLVADEATMGSSNVASVSASAVDDNDPQPTMMSIYSSRKRKRAKEKHQYIHDEHARLIDSNEGLRQSNRGLEELLADARLVVASHLAIAQKSVEEQQVMDRIVQEGVEQEQASLDAQLRLQRREHPSMGSLAASLQHPRFLEQRHDHPSIGSLTASLQHPRFLEQRHEHPPIGSLTASLGTSHSAVNAVDSRTRADLLMGLSGIGGVGGLPYTPHDTSFTMLQPNATALDVLFLQQRATEQARIAALAAPFGLPQPSRSFGALSLPIVLPTRGELIALQQQLSLSQPHARR